MIFYGYYFGLSNFHFDDFGVKKQKSYKIMDPVMFEDAYRPVIQWQAATSTHKVHSDHRIMCSA